MYRYLKDKLCCIYCRGNLIWEEMLTEGDNIIEGRAYCKKCNIEYPIHNEIASFLKPELNNIVLWERCERNRIYEGTDHVKGASYNIEELDTDELLEQIGREENNLNYEEISNIYNRYITLSNMSDTFRILKYLIERCREYLHNIRSDEIILDIASGKGIFAAEIISNMTNPIVMTDINLLLLHKTKKINNKIYSRSDVNYIACDLKKSPFKEKSIKYCTTLLGLQNIIKTDNLLTDIRRICRGTFISISAFCEADDFENIKVLKKSGIGDVWVKERFMQKMRLENWEVEIFCSMQNPVERVKEKDIKTRFAVNKFPITDTVLEYAVCICR